MAITIRRAVNAALQYNEGSFVSQGYVMGGPSKKFLTEAPNPRSLRSTERSALYFVAPDSFDGTVSYQYRDAGGTLIGEVLVDIENIVTTHNSIPVNTDAYPDVSSICVKILNLGEDVIENGDFSEGTGDTFTDWTKTTPDGSIIEAKRSNLILRSNQFTTSPWSNTTVVVSSSKADPFGGNAAWELEDNDPANYLFDLQITSIDASLLLTTSIYIKQTVTPTYPAIEIDNGSGFDAMINTATGEIIIIGSFGYLSSDIELVNGYWRLNVTHQFPSGTLNVKFLPAFSINGITPTPTATGSADIYGFQVEPGYKATAYIPTTTTAVEIYNGVGATRAPELINIGSRSALSEIVVTPGVTYKITVSAKSGIYTPPGGIVLIQIGNESSQSAYFSTPVSDEFQTFVFTVVSTGSTIKFSNGTSHSSLIVDNIKAESLTSDLSEERCFKVDSACVANEVQVQWLNKLGGGDTWVFTGYPILSKAVSRETPIEYPRSTNFTSPKRVYASRQNSSRETYQLFHRCKDQETADWLRSELIDSKDILILSGESYLPVDVIENSVVIRNTFNKDLEVSFSFRFAYDINIQSR